MKLTLDYTDQDMKDAAEMIATDYSVEASQMETPLQNLLQACQIAGLNITFNFESTPIISIDYDKQPYKVPTQDKPDDSDSLPQFPEEVAEGKAETPEKSEPTVEGTKAKNAPEKKSIEKAPEKGALISNTLSFLNRE